MTHVFTPHALRPAVTPDVLRRMLVTTALATHPGGPGGPAGRSRPLPIPGDPDGPLDLSFWLDPPPTDSPEFRYANYLALGCRWTRELLVLAIQAADRIEDEPLTRDRFLGLTGIGHWELYRCSAGGWEDLREQANVAPPRPRRFWTDHRILEELHRVVGELRRIPTRHEFRRLANCSIPTLQELGNKTEMIARYEAWLAARGLEMPVDGDRETALGYRREAWTREQLIEAVRAAAGACEGTLSLTRFRRETSINWHWIYKHFPGGWPELKQSAGLPPTPAKRYSDDDLLRAFHEARLKLGRMPLCRDLATHTPHAIATYQIRFGLQEDLKHRYWQWLANQ